MIREFIESMPLNSEALSSEALFVNILRAHAWKGQDFCMLTSHTHSLQYR